MAWCGDGNNMAISWIHAAARFEFELRLACPKELAPPRGDLDWARDHGATVLELDDPYEAARGADCVVTDTWVSMGDQASESRHRLLTPFRVDQTLMDRAPDAIFMHCLPAHRGEEVSAEVLDGPTIGGLGRGGKPASCSEGYPRPLHGLNRAPRVRVKNPDEEFGDQ